MERLSKQLDLTVVEKAFKPEFAYSAEEAFLTNTENEIVPVKAIDRNTIADGKPGEITKSLQKAYRELVKKGIDMDENE
jgi:D-alanine transaminase